MPFYRRLTAVVVGLGFLTFAWAAQAQRVALVRPPEADALLLEAFNRLSAELRIQDFEVAILDTSSEPVVESPSPSDLAEIAKRTVSVASVTFVRRGERTSVDVFIGERGNTPSRVQTIDPVNGLDVPTVLAIRTVDLLRTCLRDFGGGEPRPPPPPVPPVETKPAPPPAPPPPSMPPLWTIRAEGVMLWDRPTLGPALGASLGLARSVAKDVSVGLVLAGPIVLARNWATSQGEASVRQEMGWLELKASPWTVGPLRFGASLGAGVHRIETQGVRPATGTVAAANEWWSFAGMVGIHGDVHLTGNAALGVTVRGAGLAKRVAIAIADEHAVLEFPLLSASAGLLVGF